METQQLEIKKIRLYPSFLYFRLEKWLKKMSLQGWHLVYRKFGIVYYFEKGENKEKEYFVWTATYTGEGKYSIKSRYPLLEKTYGVSKKKSKLNRKSIVNNDTIIEVDTKKIDVSNDLYYQELKNDRDRLYLLRFLKNLFAFLIIVCAICALRFIT